MTDAERFREHVRECARSMKTIRCSLGPTKAETRLCPDGVILQVPGHVMSQDTRRRLGALGDELHG